MKKNIFNTIFKFRWKRIFFFILKLLKYSEQFQGFLLIFYSLQKNYFYKSF